jgi:predicted nucleotidyltransferase
VKLAVSETVKKRVDEVVAALAKAFGEELVAVVVHGSAVRGGWREGSNVDLVVVLKNSSREALERSANALQGARWSSRIEAMVLVEHEIARAADVFPIFYDEIRRHHVVLHGHDPFSDLRIEKHHLRLRIEQELREAQIRLRRAVVDAQGNRDALRGAVARKIKQVRSPLHALLAQKGNTGDDDLKSVLTRAGAAFVVEVGALTKVDEDPAAAHDALVSLLDAAIADVDAMEDKP